MAGHLIILIIHIFIAVVYLLKAIPIVWYDIEMGRVYKTNLAYAAQVVFALIPVYNLKCVLTGEFPETWKVEYDDTEN